MRGLVQLLRTAAGAAVLVLLLWIVLDLAGADSGNPVAHWFHQAADWLSGWSRGLFSPSTQAARTLVDYGLPAVVYAAIGVALGRRQWE
ncbi:hypothetical protein [Kitasatospora paranensis]|jgi:hypothetical protein|uniref:Uncharacterized protein n=1 Tax=Kitasatospora paranensis TaxID=258053 RepID=A0ABW2FLT1_9ACTN